MGVANTAQYSLRVTLNNSPLSESLSYLMQLCYAG